MKGEINMKTFIIIYLIIGTVISVISVWAQWNIGTYESMIDALDLGDNIEEKVLLVWTAIYNFIVHIIIWPLTVIGLIIYGFYWLIKVIRAIK
jgi:hypothetical protein